MDRNYYLESQACLSRDHRKRDRTYCVNHGLLLVQETQTYPCVDIGSCDASVTVFLRENEFVRRFTRPDKSFTTPFMK